MKLIFKSAALAVFILIQTTAATAGFIVSIPDIELEPGGMGVVDVMIESDQMGGEPLASFGFEFQITANPATTSTLQFVDPQPDPSMESAYVFSGNSGGFFQVVSPTAVPNDTVAGGDSTADFMDVNVTSPKLLTRLDVSHIVGAADPPTTIGDAFQIELITSGTRFFDSTFNNFTFDSLAFNSDPGAVTSTVTIAQSQMIVPEPSGLVLFALGGLGLLGFGLYHWRFRRRRVVPSGGA